MISAKLLMRVLVTLIASLPAQSAISANDLQYDINEHKNAAVFDQLIWKTRSCMYEGTRGMLAQGVRDSSEITTFTRNTCGSPLASFMTQTLGRSNVEVTAFIKAMAYNELQRIPGLSTPTRPESQVQQLEWNKSTVIKGIFGRAFFDNCCVGGKETKQQYLFIRLERKTNIISKINDETEPSMSAVKTIQLGAKLTDFLNIKDGQAITVSCESLWHGNTGHYALPAYCNEAKIKK